MGGGNTDMSEEIKEETKEKEVEFTKLKNESDDLKFNFSFQKKHLAKLIEIIGALLQVIGCFVPIYTINFFGMKKDVLYIEGDGIIVCVCAFAAVVLTIISKQIISLVPSIISLFIVGHTMFAVSDLSEIGGSMGSGFLFLVIGCILLTVGAILAIFWKIDDTSKKSTISAIIIIVASIVLAVALAYISEWVQNDSNYDAAVKDMKKGRYEIAIEEFNELKGFNDSKKKVKECKYLQAKEYLEKESYEDAKKLLTEIKDYKDADVLIQECDFYLLARNYSETEDFAQYIADVQEKCPDYKEGTEVINQIISEQINAYEQEEEYQKALDFLQSISSRWDVKKEMTSIKEKIKQVEAQKIQEMYESYAMEDVSYYDMSGSYKGNGESSAFISMYTSWEGAEVGNIELYLGNKYYEGVLVEVSDNLLKLKTKSGKKILLGFKYDYNYDDIVFDVYINDEKQDSFLITEHFYS